MHHLLFPVNNFFQSFFRKLFSTPLFPVPQDFLGAAVPQRGFVLCPKLSALSNTFFEFFREIFVYFYNTLKYIILFYKKYILFLPLFRITGFSPSLFALFQDFLPIFFWIRAYYIKERREEHALFPPGSSNLRTVPFY